MASTAKAMAPVVAPKPTPSKTVASKAPAKKTTAPKLSVITNKAESKSQATAAAFTALPTPAFVCNLDWKIEVANDKSVALLEEIEGKSKTWSAFGASDVSGSALGLLFADAPQEFRQANDPRNHPFSCTIPCADRKLSFTISSTWSPTGKPVGYVVTWNDVTESSLEQQRVNQRLAALEQTSSSVMITDRDLKVQYTNATLLKNLESWEPELQKLFGPGFKANELLGRCIDDFHKDPSHQRRLLANESIFPFKTRIAVGPLRIDLLVGLLKDEKGQTIGFTTDWVDMTSIIKTDEEYKAVVKEIADRMAFLKGACSTDLANAMNALAAGDLTVTLEPKTPLLDIPTQPDLALMAETFNELRNQTVKAVTAYNEARVSLSDLIHETRQSAASIARSANEVSIGNDDLAQRTEEQAASLEETASSMEEMTSTVKQNADNARQAKQLALQAREAAERGGTVVGNAVDTMGEINKASKRIADIISVIDEIAFQTNLLALNAAVEAARVGEQGRGFAVVAGEVRNLAGRSATAAKEIKSLVQDSVQKVQDGSNLVNQSGQQLDEIVNSVKKVADIISEISAAAQEQAEGIEQVNKAITQMDQITQQNASLVEEASATSQSMNQQAEGLQDIVNRFQLDEAMAPVVLKRPEPVAARGRTPVAAAPAARRPARPAKPAEDDFEDF